MLAASLVFLSPVAGLVALAVVVPLAAIALAARRERRGRVALRLPAPPAVRRLPRVLAVAAVSLLLAVAAAQPALRSSTQLQVRSDAEAMFVIDNSRSMLAAARAGAPTRLARAKAAAVALRNALPGVPTGVATLTDRVLPFLLPNPDPAVFSQTVKQAISIEEPPPSSTDVVATTLDSIGAVGTQNYFSPTARKRLLVVFTDGESRPFDPRQVAHDLSAGPGVDLVLVDMSRPGEGVFDGRTPEAGYREDPGSRQTLDGLASATGGTVTTESALGRAVAAARADLSSGPTVSSVKTTRTRTLAPFVILLALVPLLFVLLPGLGRSLRTLRYARHGVKLRRPSVRRLPA